MASWLKVMPDRLVPIASKRALSSALNVSHWLFVTAANSAPRPIVSATAMSSAQAVERREVSFVHSERSTRAWVTAIGRSIVAAVMLLPPRVSGTRRRRG